MNDPDDPAIDSVKELQREFPDRRIQLVVSEKILGANVKVSNLAQMLAEARYDHLIVNDSDIRVEPDYLRRVTAPLADPRVGMVTCLYRGVAGATLGSRLEASASARIFARAFWPRVNWKAAFALVWVPRWRSAAPSWRRLAGSFRSWIILPTITNWESASPAWA